MQSRELSQCMRDLSKPMEIIMISDLVDSMKLQVLKLLDVELAIEVRVLEFQLIVCTRNVAILRIDDQLLTLTLIS